jgi:hypothetical protein
MTVVPLWQRALWAREEEQRIERAGNRATAGRLGGYANRVHELPHIGEVFGRARIIGEGFRGLKGRSDLAFPCECILCGNVGPVFEFNLRSLPRCVGLGRKRATHK